MMQWRKKTGLCLLICSLLICLLAFGVSADEDTSWSASLDAETITDGEHVWEFYWLPDNVVCVPKHYYMLSEEWLYASGIDLSMGRPYGLRADGGDIVWTGSHTNLYLNGIYANSAGVTKLNMWQNGISENYRLRDRNTGYYAYYDDGLVEEMNWLKPTKTMDVRDLKKMPCYEVFIFDSTDTFGYPCGAIYEIEKSFYYVCYSDLDNSFFDSEGNFSYRRGTVALAKMTSDQIMLTEGAIDSLERFSPKLLEENEEPEPDVEWVEYDTTGFWIIYSFLFLIVPVPIIVLGVVFAGSKKKGYPTYYYGLSVAAGGWLLVGAGLAVLLLML